MLDCLLFPRLDESGRRDDICGAPKGRRGIPRVAGVAMRILPSPKWDAEGRQSEYAASTATPVAGNAAEELIGMAGTGVAELSPTALFEAMRRALADALPPPPEAVALV